MPRIALLSKVKPWLRRVTPQVVHLLHSETMTYHCCIQVGRRLIE